MEWNPSVKEPIRRLFLLTLPGTGKTRDIVNGVRSLTKLSQKKQFSRVMNAELSGAISKRKPQEWTSGTFSNLVEHKWTILTLTLEQIR